MSATYLRGDARVVDIVAFAHRQNCFQEDHSLACCRFRILPVGILVLAYQSQSYHKAAALEYCAVLRAEPPHTRASQQPELLLPPFRV